MDRETFLAIKRGTTDLELALIELSHYMEDDQLTPGQQRTVSSATLKMASATTQLKKMLAKVKQ